MQRKPWTRRTNRQLPRRFRDQLPQPPPALPPPDLTHPLFQPSQDLRSEIAPYRILTSSCNVFGLFRRYESRQLSVLHDPEEHVSLTDLSIIPGCTDILQSFRPTYSPYPNRSSFLLGDWYWNGGVQKSQSSFHELIDIIIDPEFRTTDIQNVNWTRIDKDLGSDDVLEWLDDDAGWTRTPISLSVPYQTRRGVVSDADAGPKNYMIGNFYHRNLTSVIREKIKGLTQESRFHFEPYELLWQKPDRTTPVRVQGELYSSPAWIKAHRDLQDSPREPGCNLQRVIVALMYSSDATHLTMFGDAKLWPLYQFFGNDTKYHRCKPSCHLCEHIAYFQSVSRVQPKQRTKYVRLMNISAASRCFQGVCFLTNCGRKNSQCCVSHSLPPRALA